MLLLVGDIGGTKTILRLVEFSEVDKSYKMIAETKYSSANFVDLVPMVQEFLASSTIETPKIACFAIAGPVVNNTSHLTNLSWVLEGSRLEKELNISKVSLINDFAANSYGVLGLQVSELYSLQTAEVQPNAPIAVIGAGTGLGESFLIPNGKNYQVFSSEGGHIDFAPHNELEIQLLKYLQAKLNHKHISVERVVSGQGIVNIYQFLRDTNLAEESPEISTKIRIWEQHTETNIDPGAIIAQAALAKSDRLCIKTLEMFVEAYGSATGNLALTLLPYGGIYIAGGIAAKILPLMKEARFLSAFQEKGRVSPLLYKMSLQIVLNPQLGLLGSILYALQDS